MFLNNRHKSAPPQPYNPTNMERHLLIRHALKLVGREDDIDYILPLLSPPADITTISEPGQCKGFKVGIIGGGLAGLSAAFELRKLGFDITIFETLENHIGGRVYTFFFDKDKNLYGEFGPMRIPVTHETVWHYLNLFKLNTRPFIQVNRNGFIYLQNTRVRNDPDGYNVKKYIYPSYDLASWEKNQKWQDLMFYGLESHLLRTNPSIRSELIRVLPGYSLQTLSWDAANSRQVLQMSGLSESAINLISSMSPSPGQILYNSYADFVSDDYTVSFSYPYEIIGGFARLPQSFYHSFIDKNVGKYYQGIPARLLGKVTWKGGHEVTGIHFCKNGKIKIAYNNIKTCGSGCDEFDYAVCSIPFSALRTVKIDPLFSERKMQAIKEIQYIAAQKTLILFKRRFWEEGGPNERIIGGASITDLPVTSVWYPSDHAKLDFEVCNYGQTPCALSEYNTEIKAFALEPGVLLASYSLGQDAVRLGNMTDENRFEEIKRELEMIHGLPKGYLDPIAAGCKTVLWDNVSWSRGAFCCYTPEQKLIFSYSAILPEYDGKIFFAGEHVSATHRWMQGALKSGMEAANGVAASFMKSRT